MVKEICFFCNRNLSKVETRDKFKMPCCGIMSHKVELYRWFLKKEKCPNCGSSHSRTVEKILNWGIHRRKERQMDDRLKSKEHKKWTKIRYEKKVRENRREDKQK